MADADELWEYWRKRSDSYEERYVDPSTVLEREKRVRLATALELAQLDGADTVGDLGVGSGRLFAHLPDNVSQIIGVDFSAPMIQGARENISNVAYVQGTAESLPLRTGSLDVLFCLGVVGHMNSDAVPAAIDEMARVLRPGGSLILSFANARSPFRRLRRVCIAARSGTHYTTYRPEYIEEILRQAGCHIRSRRYLTYSTGLLDTQANLWLAAVLDNHLVTNDLLGPLAMTWVVQASVREGSVAFD